MSKISLPIAIIAAGFIIAFAIVYISGPKQASVVEPIVEIEPSTFQIEDNPVCKEDNKPIIRLFSTTWCPHCQWVKPAFEAVAQEYADQITAYYWELDVDEVPEQEIAVYEEFNPRGSIPTFVFGCRYWRVGNGYEQEDDLEAEKAEFRQIIEDLIKD